MKHMDNKQQELGNSVILCITKGKQQQTNKKYKHHTWRLFISASTRYASSFSVSICKSSQRRENKDMKELKC